MDGDKQREYGVGGWYLPRMNHSGWGNRKAGWCEAMVTSRNEPHGWGGDRKDGWYG